MKGFLMKLRLSIIFLAGISWIIYFYASKPGEKPKEIRKSNAVNRSKEPIQKNSEQGIKVISKGSTIGFFQGVVWGDYCHFEIKDQQGEVQSYFLSDPINIDIEKYENDPSYLGKKMKVRWQEIERYIPEGGGNYIITEMTDIEELE